MDKRLQIVMETTRMVKNSEGNEVDLLFSLSLPYGIPFDLAKDVLSEFCAEIDAGAQKAEEIKKAQEAQAPVVQEVK